MTWVRTKGRYTINANYSFSKSMGIVNPGLDQFNLANDYGVLPANRTHIFNPPTPLSWGISSSRKVAGGFINGWQVSGIRKWRAGRTSPV